MSEPLREEMKRRKLQKFKTLALLLLLFMAVVYAISTWLKSQYQWLGYVQAFSEAAMVGALADWFAVSALFHYPMGIKIPHTNLIENSKHRIGENLGGFVVQNFITADIVRARLKDISVADKLGEWMANENNRSKVVGELMTMAEDLVDKADKKQLVHIVTQQATALVENVNAGGLISDVVLFVLENRKHDPFVESALEKIEVWISENEELIKERVKKESSAFVPGFIDNIIAKKITQGFLSLAEEVRSDKNHNIRKDLDCQLEKLSVAIKTSPEWETQLQDVKHKLVSGNAIEEFATQAVDKLLNAATQDFQKKDSAINHFLNNMLLDIATQLQNEEGLRVRIDNWIRFQSFRLILKSRDTVGTLISQTVGNWHGAELSEKLELEVGKDLQYIRINGTIVGGLVGLAIYAITQLVGG